MSSLEVGFDMWENTILEHPEGESFYQAYGRAAIAWNKLEHELCLWFAMLLNSPLAVGEAIFYSAKSFQGKSALIEEVIETGVRPAPLKEDAVQFLKSAVKKAVQFNGFRNTIAHGVPYAGKRTKGLALATGRHLRELETAELIETATLEIAATNFIALQQILRKVFLPLCGQDGIPPEEGRERLLALPTRADRREADPKTAKKRLQPRSSRPKARSRQDHNKRPSPS